MQLIKKYYDFCQNNNYDIDNAQIKTIKLMQDFNDVYFEKHLKKEKSNFLNHIKTYFYKKEIDICGIYLYGGVGRGKSMLMDLFFEALEVKQKQRIHLHKFMETIHSLLKEARNNNAKDALLFVADKIAKNYKFICFDEFQVLDITDAMLLGRLFAALIERNINFIITSNRPPKDLYLNGLNRQLFFPFIELLYSRFNVIALDHNTDYRFKKIPHKSHYLYPLNEESFQKFNSIWNVLTDKALGTYYIIKNSGREIKINRTYKNIAFVNFDDLCNVPLNSSDYLAISEKFSILLLDNIPQLTSEMRNEATRFRNLIDTYYENKHKIYFRCDVSVENLYIAGDYSFEFERTVSRIQEMQSETWYLML